MAVYVENLKSSSRLLIFAEAHFKIQAALVGSVI